MVYFSEAQLEQAFVELFKKEGYSEPQNRKIYGITD